MSPSPSPLLSLPPDLLTLVVLCACRAGPLELADGDLATPASVCHRFRDLYETNPSLQTALLLSVNDDQAQPALCVAVRHLKTGVCRRLLVHEGAEADAGDSIALWMAARYDNAEICRLLLDPAVAGAQHRARADARDSNALWTAAHNGNAEICRLLMDPAVAGPQHRARADADDSYALRMAALGGHIEVCRLLLDPAVTGPQHRARVDALGGKALALAAERGHADVCRLLMDPAYTGARSARV